jgi:hypothetical protein
VELKRLAVYIKFAFRRIMLISGLLDFINPATKNINIC